MILYTIDPGIDRAGVAIWDTDNMSGRPSRGFYDAGMAIHALESVHSIRTNVGDNTLQRCAVLAEELEALMRTLWPARVYIEIPPTWHATTMKKLGAGGVITARDKLNRSVGALAVGAASTGAQVFEAPASKLGKDWRLAKAEECAAGAGRPVPRNEDERSAVWIGLELLTESGLWKNLQTA